MQRIIIAVVGTLVIAITVLRVGGVPPKAAALGGPQILLDANVTNGGGPCGTIDDAATVTQGASFDVAICASNLAEHPAAIRWRLVYDDTVISGTSGACLGTALDCNPDFNGGATVYSGAPGWTTNANAVGSPPGVVYNGWDCTGGGVSLPTMDMDPATGAGHGVAYSGGCLSTAGPYTLGVPGCSTLPPDSGPGNCQAVLAVLHFNGPNAVGVTNLALQNVEIYGESVRELGTCDPEILVPTSCTGVSPLAPASVTVTMSVGGIAEQPDVTGLPAATTSSDGHRTAYALGGIALAMVAAFGAAGWYVGRKRAA
jgi:hypothetical protein